MSILNHSFSTTTLAHNTQIFDTEIGSLCIEQRGRTPGGETPILLWPSLFSDRHMYDRLVTFLENDHVLVLLDPPGHGQSKLGLEPLSLAATARATLDVLQRLGVERVYWVGTSWGGMIGIHAALQARHRVAHLACINTPFDIGASVDIGTRFILAGAKWIGNTRLFADGVARTFFQPETLAADSKFAAKHRAVFIGCDRHALHRVAHHVLTDRENLSPVLPKVTVPTLVLAGRQDTMYPVEKLQAAAELIPDGQFQVIENSRHISAADAPEAVNMALRSAWADVSKTVRGRS